MPFYIAPGGHDIVTLDDLKLGLGELGAMEDGEVRSLNLGESFAFLQSQGHAVGFTQEEVGELIAQLTRVAKRWEKQDGEQADASNLN